MGIGSAVALATERIVEPVEGMHRAIAGRWFAAMGPAGRPVRVAHTTISRLVYGSVRLGATVVGLGLDARVPVEPRTAESIQAFVNGLWGDALGRHEHGLATSMSIRDRHGAPVVIGPEVTAAFPEATGRLVVLVHGLAKTERCWNGAGTEPGLTESLGTEAAFTPVAIRYNTGLPVSVNGARLASLLEDLHSNWSVPIESIALVGHSMGGLVAAGACTAARQVGHRWIGDLTDVVTIGSPHRGAPLEKLAAAAAWCLDVASPTRPLAEFLNRRSQGIKDLRSGTGGAADRERHRRGDAVGEPAPARSVRHHLIGGVITFDPTHVMGRVVGDLMVRPVSSTRAPGMEPTNVVVLGGVHHFDMLHEPAVIDCVMGWLTRQTAEGRATATSSAGGRRRT